MVDNVRLVNSEVGKPVDVHKSRTTNALVTGDFLNHMVHEGELYSVSGIDSAVVDAASSELLLVVLPGKVMHLGVSGSAGGDAYAYMFENTAISANGTEITPINRNRGSTNNATTAVYQSPAVTSDGDVILSSFSPGGTKKSAVGSAGASFGEWILPEGNYLLRFKNVSGAPADMSMILDFYEEDAD